MSATLSPLAFFNKAKPKCFNTSDLKAARACTISTWVVFSSSSSSSWVALCLPLSAMVFCCVCSVHSYWLNSGSCEDAHSAKVHVLCSLQYFVPLEPAYSCCFLTDTWPFNIVTWPRRHRDTFITAISSISLHPYSALENVLATMSSRWLCIVGQFMWSAGHSLSGVVTSSQPDVNVNFYFVLLSI